MENVYNRKRTTSFTIAAGSFVLLDRAGIKWSPDAQRSKMLLQRYLGPFKVASVNNSRNNVKLELPPHMRCHDVFHISLLREWIAPNRDFPDRSSPKPLVPACTKDGHEEYEIDRILDSRLFGRWKKRKFLIHWKDTESSEDTWETEDFLTSCPLVLSDYLARLSPNRPYGSRGGVVTQTRSISYSMTLSVT
jgi:hypothetical protein